MVIIIPRVIEIDHYWPAYPRFSCALKPCQQHPTFLWLKSPYTLPESIYFSPTSAKMEEWHVRFCVPHTENGPFE